MFENSFILNMGLWNWFIIAALFGVLEVMVPGYFLIWYGLAALFVGGLALAVDISWQIQLVLYVAIGIVLLILSMRFSGNKTGDSDRPLLNKRGESLIGQRYELIDATKNGRGSVKIGDSIWAIQLEDGANLAKGDPVLITKVKGTKLIGKAA